MFSITDEYLNYYNIYSKKYGKKTLILMMVGSFYECYSTYNNNTGEGPDLHELSQILNIVCTRKDKSINTIDRKNPYMLGFPLVSSSKFINMLIEYGYTLVVIDQVSPPPNPKRDITGIYSPGTYINGPQKPDYNFIACVYIEENIQRTGKYLLCSGMSAIDVTTGKCYIYEAYSAESDDKYSLDECLRFLNGINPTETIIYFKEQENGMKKEDLYAYLEIHNKRNIHYKKEFNKKYTTLNYQVEFLRKIYPDCGQFNPIEYLGMDKYIYSTCCLVLLMDFLYEHNNKIVDNLNKPEFYYDSRTVILGNNAINQLNIIENNTLASNSKFNSLFSVVNNTSTHMGRRFLRDRLTCPLISHQELNKNYDCVQELIIGKLYVEVENILKDIFDIERLEHKIPLGYLHPYELAILYQSYEQINKLIDIIDNTKYCREYCPDKKSINLLHNFKKDIDDIFNYEELKKHNLTEITTNIFNKGVCKDIDKIEDEIFKLNNFINFLKDALCEYAEDKSKKKNVDKDTLISIKKNERDGHYLNITKIRCNVLKKNLEKVKTLNVGSSKVDPKNLIFKENNNNVKIILPDLEEKSDQIKEQENIMRNLNMKNYLLKLKDVYDKYNIMFKTFNKFVSLIDYLKSNAKSALLFGYSRPIIEYNKDSSFIECAKLRHPIIERLIDHEYIPHDMKIGKDLKGILLYGLNSSGKCFDPDTLIKMHNGSHKKAKDIIKGDKLMGDDSTARIVLSTTSGKAKMYKIIPIKGQPIIVNGPHILVLKCSGYKSLTYQSNENRYKVIWLENDKLNYKYFAYQNNKEIVFNKATKFFDNVKTDKGKIIEISVDDYLKKSKQWQNNYYLYKVGIEYEEKKIHIDPYILGHSLANNNLAILHKYKLNNKHIPNDFKYNSTTIRLKLLAGILDSHYSKLNNYGFDLCSQNETLMDDIIELCRSLGLSCYKERSEDYYKTFITGDKLNKIPSQKYIIPENIKKDSLVTSFKIENIGVGNYCGFEVDGNKRFLLDDFTVTHNSSSMKALGLCTIMAQAGMFVPAEKCIYSPYKSIFTRITGNDNLFKGLSSFTLEMLELKAILNRADPYTLVIGDEVCRGTEHISGNAIVASTIINLAKLNSSFIFATHLHEIAQMNRVKEIKTIRPFHLSVTYDPKNDVLIYDRQLKEGQGEPIYGITVARYIISDNSFVDLALEIKNELLNDHGSLISGKTSKYNSEIYIHECQLCHKKDMKGFISNLQTHHINFQKNCDENGLVKDKPHLRKNDKANLVVICIECHEKIHHQGLDVQGLILTSKGKQIKIKNNSEQSSEEEIRINFDDKPCYDKLEKGNFDKVKKKTKEVKSIDKISKKSLKTIKSDDEKRKISKKSDKVEKKIIPKKSTKINVKSK